MDDKKVARVKAFSLLFTLVSLFTPMAWSARWATVRTEGAMVFKKPDFDSDVVGYLKDGERIKVASKKYGVFYRTKINKNTIGYVSDADLLPIGKTNPSEKEEKAKKEDDFKEEKKENEDEDSEEPLYYKSYVGVAVNYTKYAEKLAGGRPSDDIMQYGVKLTGPDFFLSIPMDMTLAFLYGSPSYYTKLSTGARPTGYMVFLDFDLIYPLYLTQSSAVTLGLGPLFIYSLFTVVVGAEKFELEEFKVGASFELAYSLAYKKWAVRFEGKYYWEKMRYPGAGIAIQHQF